MMLKGTLCTWKNIKEPLELYKEKLQRWLADFKKENFFLLFISTYFAFILMNV